MTTRRKFLQSAALASAGLTINGLALDADAASNRKVLDSGKKRKPGVIGKDSIKLAADGKSRCTIFVSTRIMEPDQNVPQKDLRSINAELYRRQLRESVLDLALYFEKLSGASIPVVTNAADVQGIAVQIAEEAETVFGPVGISVMGGQGYRVVADNRGVG